MNPFLSTVYFPERCLLYNCVQIVLNGVGSVFSGGGNQSVLLATVSTGGPRHRGGEEEEWSVSVVVENALGNSSEVVVVLQGEVEWWGALLCSVCISRSPHVTVT